MIPQINVPATGERIKDIMQSKGLTVKDVQAACMFTTPQAVYKWLHGTSLPTLDNLVIVANLFAVRLDDLIVVERS